jgi:hypothetical protein
MSHATYTRLSRKGSNMQVLLPPAELLVRAETSQYIKLLRLMTQD